MLGLEVLDWIVLLGYFIVITIIGLWTYKKLKSSSDFFMGNRRFGKIMMIAQAFGVGTHSDQPVSVSGASYTNGLAGIWYQWIWMFSTPFFWIISPIYRRLRYVTMSDFFEQRYGTLLSIFYTIVGMIYFAMDIGIMLKGTGITIEGITGGVISETTVILVATMLFVVYGLAGGIIAAVITDLIQGVLILVLSFMLIPFAIDAAGGIHAIHSGLPERMFSLVAPFEVTLFFIIMAVINGLVGIVIRPHHMAVGGSGRSEISCRTGWTFGNFLKRFATMGWAFAGVFAAFLYPELAPADRELAFGMLAGNLLPVGLVGLMIAALSAAVMSTCDAFMVHASALFTRNVYLSYINPKATDRDLLKVGRVSSIAIVIIGLFFAFVFESVIHGLTEVWKVTAYLGIAFWFGVIWKKANRYGAWASALSMAATSLFANHVLHWSLPHQIALYLPVGFVMMWVVSYFTKPEPEEKLHHFYTLLDTPVGKEHRLKEQNIPILLEGVSEGKKVHEKEIDDKRDDDGLLIVDLLSLRSKFSWKRYKTDILGFSVAVALAAFMIMLTLFLANIGA